ncbi:MAG: phosphoribosylamine--glycine ligase [Deltaproteobacteria bacterium]|nr:phosphoribosylamine--glycine ligase [Deltaproteobacteria bacterium]
MNILLLGSGGREHALAWKILQSHHQPKLFVAPGSDAIAQIAECVALNPSNPEQVLEFSLRSKIDLVVVGPEAPLVAGVADRLRENNISVFGPIQSGAELEASKAYTKTLLKERNIPTAAFETFSDYDSALQYLKNKKYPQVIKADGLAAGKGVVICESSEEATKALEEILIQKSLGAHQTQVVIEDFLKGEEASFMVVTDGKTFLPLATSQDHKRLQDHDHGPNTGGMGAYSPAPVVTPTVHERTLQKMIQPTLEGLQSRKIDYRGVLYAGLMIDHEEPSLLEYNVRFGDPECQVILPRLKSDFVDLMLATAKGELASYKMEWHEKTAVCVVMASAGYPASARKGDVIEGLEKASKLSDVMVFHAGTALQEGKWVTHGGRVLGVTAWGDTLEKAVQKVYEAVSLISFSGMQYRKDIAAKALAKREIL